MKRLFTITLLVAMALLSGCRRHKIIPERELAAIFHDAMLVNAYVNLQGVDIDSLNIYEPIFEKHGYTTDDIRYTITNFSRRKNARLGDVAEYMIKQFELESQALKREVSKLDTINNVAERLFHSTLLRDTAVEIRGKADTAKLHYIVPIKGEGVYDFSFSCSIDEPDKVRGRRLTMYKMRRDSSKVLLYQNQLYIDHRNNSTNRQKIESGRDSSFVAFYIDFNDRKRVDERDRNKPAHLTIHELKVDFQPPTEECVRLLFNEQTKLRIFSDTMLRANEQAAQRSVEAASK